MSPAKKGSLPPFMLSKKNLTRFLTECNIVLLKYSRGELGEIFRQFAKPENYPCVFGCSAGKDRTGLTAALLLGMVGASRSQILADFMLTNETHTHKLQIADALLEESKRQKQQKLTKNNAGGGGGGAKQQQPEQRAENAGGFALELP